MKNSLGLATAAQPRLLTPEQMRHIALRNLGLVQLTQENEGNGQQSAELMHVAISAEVIRAALWGLTGGGHSPSYTTRILHTACRLVEPALLVNHLSVSTDTRPRSQARQDHEQAEQYLPEDLVRDGLSDLELVGDVAALPKGYWMPAPLRLVSLPGSRQWLLVGGVPTHCLPAWLTSQVKPLGVTRIMLDSAPEPEQQLPIQSLDDWCRTPQEPVDVWASRVLAQSKLGSVEQLQGAVEYYAPRISRPFGAQSPLHYYRWMPDAGKLPDQRYLARLHIGHKRYRYMVAAIDRGKLSSIGSIQLEDGDIRRLLYGIDALEGCPVQARVIHTGDARIFKLENELPRSEYRLFAALGRLSLPADGKYYPRSWAFPAEVASQAVQALSRLGILLQGQAQ